MQTLRIALIATYIALGFIANTSVIAQQVESERWRPVSSPADRVFTFAQHGNRLFAGTENTGLWVSSNGGQTWQIQQTGLFEMTYDFSSLLSNGNTLWAGIRGGGVCRSLDGGTTWQTFNDGFQTQSFVAGVQQIGDVLYAAVESNVGLQDGGIYTTSVSKANWVRRGTGIPTAIPEILSFKKTASNALIIASTNSGTRRGNIYVSTDLGKTWQDRRIADAQNVSSLEVAGDIIFAGTSNGVYISTTLGETWSKFGLQGKYVDVVTMVNGVVCASVDGEGVYMSDSGNWWLSLTENLPTSGDFVSALFVHNNKLLAALSATKGVWAFSFTTTSVNDSKNTSTVVLGQNYPNPTHGGTTTIPLSLQKSEAIRLVVVDALGRTVKNVLDNEVVQAGTHLLNIDLQGLPVGVYHYQLTTSTGILRKSLVHQ